MQKTKLLRNSTIIVIIAVLFIAILASSSLYIVAENEYACIVRFSKIIDTKSSAGLYLKVPFIDTIKTFPKTILLYDIPPSEVLTTDQKNMTVDSFIMWKIEDPLIFFKTLGTISVAELRLDALTYNALKNLMGTLRQQDIINEDKSINRNDFYQSIATNVATLTKIYGINIVDVKIKRFDLPTDNERTVYQRMISERNQMAKKFTAEGDLEASLIINNTDKQVNIVKSDAKAEAAALIAQGEAEYMRLLAETFNTQDKKSFFEYKLALEALVLSLEGNEKIVILDSESSLGKLLLNP